MELSRFKKLMKSKFGIDIKQVFINIEKKPIKECVWSEIAWRDCPILVKESGFKSSKPIIRFIARKNFNRGWDSTIYITNLTFIKILDCCMRYDIPINGDIFAAKSIKKRDCL